MSPEDKLYTLVSNSVNAIAKFHSVLNYSPDPFVCYQGLTLLADHRPAFATAARFPGAAVRLAKAGSLRSEIDLTSCHAAVVMSHHLASDEAYLRELADAGVPAYVGLLGPAARRNRLVRELGPAAERLISRIYGPVGADIGAATPEGIALAIISQIHAWLAGRDPAGAAIPQGFT